MEIKTLFKINNALILLSIKKNIFEIFFLRKKTYKNFVANYFNKSIAYKAILEFSLHPTL